MILQETILIVAMAATLVPVVCVLFRGQSKGLVILGTLLAAAFAGLHFATVLKLVTNGPTNRPDAWTYVLIGGTLPLLLSGYLFSQFFGRDDPWSALRFSRRTLFLLTIVGIALLVPLRQASFVRGYDWADGRGTVHLGSVGKAYLAYLMIGIVAIGYNLEKTYRIASAEMRPRLRLPVIGVSAMLAYLICTMATGMLYSAIGLGKLIAGGIPATLAAMAVGYGQLRGALVDVKSPVSRNVVYSSFTAIAAALVVLAIAAAAQVASWTRWSPDEILAISAVFLAVLLGGLFVFSNRFQRSVRRFIDRNFYVNRYDYRSQWSLLTRALSDSTETNAVLDRVGPLLLEVFAADGYTIALKDSNGNAITPRRGKGTHGQLVLEPDSPLHTRLAQGRRALQLDRRPSDFTYIPIYAEDDQWLDATASQVIAPLLDGNDLVGTIGVERRGDRDAFTYEDVELLDSVAAHVAASLRSAQLVRELTETREMEMVSQWSSMLLHDLKNHLAPLRMAATNLVEVNGDRQLVQACAQDIGRVADRMEGLVQRLSELRRNHNATMDVLRPGDLVREVVSDMPVLHTPSMRVELALGETLCTHGDKGMLRRVLENLFQNALEAMDGRGTITVTTEDVHLNGSSKVRIIVADTGPGIPEEFIRERLFHPFATTKRKGLGLGLYQCRTIVRNHGGDLCARSQPGHGAVFEMSLAASDPAGLEAEAGSAPMSERRKP